VSALALCLWKLGAYSRDRTPLLSLAERRPVRANEAWQLLDPAYQEQEIIRMTKRIAQLINDAMDREEFRDVDFCRTIFDHKVRGIFSGPRHS